MSLLTHFIGITSLSPKTNQHARIATCSVSMKQLCPYNTLGGATSGRAGRGTNLESNPR